MSWYIFGGGFGNVGEVYVMVRAMEEGFGIGLVGGGIRCFKKLFVEYGVRVQVAKLFCIIFNPPI